MMPAPFFCKREAGFRVWALKGQAHPKADEMLVKRLVSVAVACISPDGNLWLSLRAALELLSPWAPALFSQKWILTSEKPTIQAIN